MVSLLLQIHNLVVDIEKHQKKEEKYMELLEDARNTIIELEKEAQENQRYKKDVELKLYDYEGKVRLLEETITVSTQFSNKNDCLWLTKFTCNFQNPDSDS